MDPRASKINEYWVELGREAWFRKDPAVDSDIRSSFEALHCEGLQGRLSAWAGNAAGSLALVLLFDQFPRNMFRGDAHAFSTDSLALSVATRAIANGWHREVDPALSDFFFMPFMHSECIADQDRCIELMHAHSTADSLRYARLHRDIIARFGRFPHRNQALGRHTTHAERVFLENGGFSG
jgi:uncharacterized protein (DUF924 family)